MTSLCFVSLFLWCTYQYMLFMLKFPLLVVSLIYSPTIVGSTMTKICLLPTLFSFAVLERKCIKVHLISRYFSDSFKYIFVSYILGSAVAVLHKFLARCSEITFNSSSSVNHLYKHRISNVTKECDQKQYLLSRKIVYYVKWALQKKNVCWGNSNYLPASY